MLILPEQFIAEMQELLGTDYSEYAALKDDPPYRGVTVNRLKTDAVELCGLLPFKMEQSPFNPLNFYIPSDVQGIGSHPLHCAGAFYVQEPSASAAVTLLDVQHGDRVLDLCSAPGGKSAQIASALGGTGLLWSNEVVKSRAQILLSNYERMGIANGVVSSCYPEILCEKLAGFFDRVLVDAPCSGEGMFRKNHNAAAEWTYEHKLSCAERQLSILRSAAGAVRKGGVLVYSTCTFSHEENEGVITRFLAEHPDFEPCEVHEPFGRKTELSCAVRITPLEGGEGHFAAKLHRREDTNRKEYDGYALSSDEAAAKTKNGKRNTAARSVSADKMAGDALNDILISVPHGRKMIINDKLFLLPDQLPDLNGLGVIRAGLLAGEWKKNRFEPAHALFMAYRTGQFHRVLELSLDDERVGSFLRGYEIDSNTDDGYTAVACCGMTLGYGKCSSGRLKNKYPKGLRNP